jgi:hypothetical protein
MFKSDLVKEIDGVWVEIGEGVRLRIARLNNPKYTVKLLELRRAHWEAHGRRNPDLARQAEILTRCLAETVLVGWDGVTDDAGNPLPYSVERAYEFLSDPSLHDLREIVMEEAQKHARYRDDDLEGAAKN